MTTECVNGDHRVTIYQFSNARSQHYSLFQKLYKDAIITGSVMEIIERNLTATLALNADVKTAILSLHDVLFNKIFRAQMELFLSQRDNSFRRVLEPLYEATWLHSRTGSN